MFSTKLCPSIISDYFYCCWNVDSWWRLGYLYDVTEVVLKVMVLWAIKQWFGGWTDIASYATVRCIMAKDN